MALSHLLDTLRPRLLTEAANGGLKPSPTERLRRVLLHLSYSMALSHLLDTILPQLLTGAAHGGLKPSPTGRLRRVRLHLSYSMALSHLLDTTPPRLLSAAACGGLRSAPDHRTRRALLHLSYSCAPHTTHAALVTHGPWRNSRGHRRGMHRHEPGLHRRHCRKPAQRPDHLRQIPRRQAHQRSRRRGSPGRTEEPRRTEEEPLPLAQEPVQPVAAPARPVGQPLRREPQDRAGISHPPRLPGALRPAHQERRGVPQEMVLVGHPQPPAADDRRGTHGQTPLERHSPLVPHQDRQRHYRGHQQPRPSRQSQSSWLPLHPQPQGDHLSNCWQARTRVTHMSQRRAFVLSIRSFTSEELLPAHPGISRSL